MEHDTSGRHAHTAPPRARFDPLHYVDPAPRPWLIHALGPLVHHVVLPHVLRLTRFELPAADLARLRAAVNPTTAAFIGPNHPEFMTDWMIDKELSRRVSPLMAHWASYEIVNLNPTVQWLWLANNLIATVPEGGGKAYSLAWARRGHGVLLHPEGTVNWHGDHVGPLLPGVVDMAWDLAAVLAAAGDARPVFTVPIAWKLVFERDVSTGLGREMAHMERVLGLPARNGLPAAARFGALQIALLAKRAATLGIADVPADLAPRDYFVTQERVAAELHAWLDARYGQREALTPRSLHRLRRAVRARADGDPDGARVDRTRLIELTRLAGFPAAIYDTPTLTQEHIAENLKRTRALLMTRGRREALHNLVPRAVGPRSAHVRVAEPQRVHEAFAAARAGGELPEAVRESLLAEHGTRLTNTLAALVAELAPLTGRFRRENPLYRNHAR